MHLKNFLMIWAKIQLYEFPKRGLKKKIVTIYGIPTLERMRCSDMSGKKERRWRFVIYTSQIGSDIEA